MSALRFYDKNTLFIKCDCASSSQIQAAFRTALTNYREKTGKDIQCSYRVNVISNHQGELFGIAFVFVTNSAVYHMLLGKNEDGSDRVQFIDDPSWVSPSNGELINEDGWGSISGPVMSSPMSSDSSQQGKVWEDIPPPVISNEMSWAEVADLEDEYERKLAQRLLEVEGEKNRHLPPKITVHLEPLMSLPPFELTPEQREHKRAEIISSNEGKPGFDPNLIEIPKFAHFDIDRAMVTAVDENLMPNILKCKNVPDWISKEDLKAQFTPYASDSKTLHDRIIRGRHVGETYPFVNINEERVAFIIYDPSTHDAQFALHMMKKTPITKKGSDGTAYNATLIFKHSYCTDRDLMSIINQQPRPIRPNHRSNDTPASYRFPSRAPRGGASPRGAASARWGTGSRGGARGRGIQANPEPGSGRGGDFSKGPRKPRSPATNEKGLGSSGSLPRVNNPFGVLDANM